MIKTDPNLHTFPPSYFPTTQSPCSQRLVGYTTMIIQLFEPLREWVYKTRRSKGSVVNIPAEPETTNPRL